MLLPSAFQIVTKPCGPSCNLACTYCFYRSKEKLYPHSNLRMDDGLLQRYIRQYMEAHHSPEITFNWQGGEPTLLGVDFFQRALEFQQRYRRPGMQILNTLQTNGTLLDEKWCRFFRQNHFLVGISLDGPRAEHDAFRVDKGGGPTFDRVMEGVRLLREHQVEFNVLASVHRANGEQGREVYRFLRDEVRAAMIQFIPIVKRKEEGHGLTDSSVTGAQYGRFLISVFDEWLRRDVGRVFVQLFDVSLGVWLGVPSSLCVFAKTCGDAPAMEHNGDLFSCDHFVDSEHRLGNITRTPLADLVVSHRQRSFGLEKQNSLPETCRNCSVRFICNGGCPKDRFVCTPEGEPGLNVLCEGFHAFFHHIDRPMRIMADLISRRRSPATIMEMDLDREPLSR